MAEILICFGSYDPNGVSLADGEAKTVTSGGKTWFSVRQPSDTTTVHNLPKSDGSGDSGLTLQNLNTFTNYQSAGAGDQHGYTADTWRSGYYTAGPANIQIGGDVAIQSIEVAGYNTGGRNTLYTHNGVSKSHDSSDTDGTGVADTLEAPEIFTDISAAPRVITVDKDNSELGYLSFMRIVTVDARGIPSDVLQLDGVVQANLTGIKVRVTAGQATLNGAEYYSTTTATTDADGVLAAIDLSSSAAQVGDAVLLHVLTADGKGGVFPVTVGAI